MGILKLFKYQEARTCDAVHFIFNYARKSKRSATYKRSYRCIARHLQNYELERGVKLLSNNFDANTAEDFVDFLKDKNLMSTTIHSYYAKVCHMFISIQLLYD